MEIVAQHLQKEAVSRAVLLERDLFGRSAFNRYYYATFLDVKDALGTLRGEWGRMAHASVPEVLTGTVQNELKKGLKRAQKATDHETVMVCSRALAATKALAALMEVGYMTRVVAGYEPEIKIDFSNGNDFQLNSVRVGDAASWPYKARGYIGTITLAWRQVHV